MLDPTTKRQIDSARDILVGKVPDPKAQIDQITTALIYKFMDDMDKESQELGGEARFFADTLADYSWTKLMDSKLSGEERLNMYREAIEQLKVAPNIPELFRNIFKNYYLSFYDPRTLSLFLKEINQFSYDNSENLGNAFEYLLSILGSQGDAGQFRTPRHIIDFIVEIVDPKKNETILDPACGTAGFLISAYKYIIKKNSSNYDPTTETDEQKILASTTALDTADSQSKTYTGDLLTPDDRIKLTQSITGYDIDANMVKLALVNLYLHNFLDPKIYEYDTLTNDKRWGETFDVILANPPFMTPKGGIVPHNRFSIKANRAEVLFVDYIAEHLSSKGRAGIIVPEGIIFQSSNAYKNLRKSLIENWGLYAVVSLPSGVFQPYSGVKTSILLLDKEFAKKTDEILFVKVENDGFDLGAQRREIDKNDLPLALNIIIKFKSTLSDTEFSEDEKQRAHVVAKEKIAESGDYNLSGERYKEVVHFVNQKWPMVELEEVCEILNGYAFKSENYVNNGVRIIRITNVQKGQIVDDNPKFYPTNSKEPIAKYNLRENDLLVSLTGNVGRVGLLPKDFLPAVLNQRVACLRAKENKINVLFLFYILNQNKFEDDCVNSASGIAQKNLSTVWLSKYKIPLPPLEVQKEIVEQIEVKQKAIDHAKAVIESLERERRYFGQALRKLEGIEWVELGEVADFVRGPFGGSLKKEIFKPSGVLVYEQYHAINNDFNFARYFIDDKKFEEMQRFEVFPGDLLISCSGTMGKIALVPEGAKRGIINQALLKLTPHKQRLFGEYLKLVLDADFIQSKYFRDQSGTSIQNVASVKVLQKIQIPLPPLEVQKQLVAEAEKEEEIITANRRLIEIMEQKIKAKLDEVWEND